MSPGFRWFTVAGTLSPKPPSDTPESLQQPARKIGVGGVVAYGLDVGDISDFEGLFIYIYMLTYLGHQLTCSEVIQVRASLVLRY